MQSNASTPENPAISQADPQSYISPGMGAQYSVTHMSRKSKAYLINDDAIEALQEIGSTNTVLWAILSAAVSQFVAALWDVGFTAEGNKQFGGYWIILCVAIAGSCGAALHARKGKTTKFIDRIKAESFES